MKRPLSLLCLLLLPLAALAGDAPAPSLFEKLSNLFYSCWACGIFNTIGAIGLSFADNVFKDLADGMKILIGLFMALWLLYFAAKLFLPFGAPGASHWNMGAAKLMKLLFVLAFLAGSGPFWDYIFTPVLSTGLGLASQLATAADDFEKTFGADTSVPSGVTDYCKGPIPDTDIRNLSKSAQSALAALEQLDCPLSKIQSEFGKGIVIGVATISNMGCDDSWWQVIPGARDMAALVAGAVLILIYLFGFLSFPFLLIDVLARVILVAATSPLAIASVLFKPTARIAERAMWSLAHAGLTMMFGAAIAGIGKALIAFIMQQMTKQSSGATLLSWLGVQSAVNDACKDKFIVNLSTANFYMLAATGIVIIFMMRRASSLAAELTGISGGTGAQAGFASVAGAAAGAAGKAVQASYLGWAERRKDSRSRASDVAGTRKE